MLVPGMLRSILRERGLEDNVKIGFFLHVPFPVFEDIGDHERELMRGVLGADLIGFHVDTYRQNFISSVNTVDGVTFVPDPGEGRAIWYGGRRIQVGTYPIGIDPESWTDVFCESDTIEFAAWLREKFDGYRLMVSAQRADPAKGILEQLTAYEAFLRQKREHFREYERLVEEGRQAEADELFRQYRLGEDTVLFLVAQPTRTGVLGYAQYARLVRQRVSQINAEFGEEGKEPPIFYFADSSGNPIGTNKYQTAALYQVADVFWVNSLADGMNIMSFEFIAVNHDDPDPGVLMLSIYAGAHVWLGESVVPVNPFDPVDPDNPDSNSMVHGLRMALSISDDDKIRMVETGYTNYVARQTARRWARSFMLDLMQVSPHPEP